MMSCDNEVEMFPTVGVILFGLTDIADPPRMAAATDTGVDRQLQLRMLAAFALVLLMPVALIYTFQTAANTIGIALFEWLSGNAYHGRIYVDPVAVGLIVVVGVVSLYRFGPQLVVSSLQTRRPWDDHSASDIDPMVTKLAAQIDLPPPTVEVIESEMPNALALGTPKRSRIVLTTALIELLNEAELEAVIAHEFAHIKNRDASLMTIAWVIPTITYYLAILAVGNLTMIYRMLGAGTAVGRRNGRAVVAAIIAVTVTALVTLAISAVFWIASVSIYRILSRYREYAADRGAAAITGSPATLASALQAIDTEIRTVSDRDLRQFDGGAEALYFAPLDTDAFEDKSLISADLFPATHPPTEARIDRLQELTAASHE